MRSLPSTLGDFTDGEKLSNILDLGNGFSLKQLGEEARNENVTMRRLAEKSTEDSAAVKVLTIITLIYLPATVVSVNSALPRLCAVSLLIHSSELLFESIRIYRRAK